MTAVMLFGDSHADAHYVANILRSARCWQDGGINHVIQLGDFGYTFDKTMIASIAAWLDQDERRRFYWLDGNHDDHDYIQGMVAEHGWQHPINMRGKFYVSGNNKGTHFPDRMFYLPRGCVFSIGETNILTVGGAYSIDKYYRTEGLSYWKEETITPREAERAIDYAAALGGVDVMLSHDTVCSEWFENNLEANGYKVDYHSQANRKMLSWITDEVRPQELYHGHYHDRYDDVYTTPEGWDVRVHGLAANFTHERMTQEAIGGHNYIVTDW